MSTEQPSGAEEWPPQHAVIDKWFEEQSPDIILQVEGFRLPCHKEVLMNQSEYFKAMFNTNMIEASQSVIELHDINVDILRVLIRNAYCRDLRLNPSSVCDILSGASMLQFDAVIRRCEFYLMKTISMGNCLIVMAVTETLPVPAVYNLARNHALWHFDQLIWTPEFLSLPLETIMSYLTDTMIRTTSDMNVFVAAVNWLKHLTQERAPYVDRVLNTVRVETLSKSQTEKLLEHPYAKSHVSWSQRLRGRLKELDGDVEDATGQKRQYFVNREHRKVPYSLWRVGGTIVYDDHTEWATDISRLSLNTAKQSDGVSQHVVEHKHNGTVITHVPTLEQSLDEEISGYKACMVGTALYISGGEMGLGRNKWALDVCCFDVLRCVWSQVTKLQAPRRHHSAIGWDHFLYLIGGFGKHRILQDSVQCYDTRKDEWTKRPPLNAAVFSAAVCICSDRLFVIRHSIEYLDRRASTWTTITAPLPFEIGIHSCVTAGSDIYVAGSYIRDIIKIDTNTHKVNKLASFTEASGPLEMIDDCIYNISGQDSDCIECFNIHTQQVSCVAKMKGATKNHSVVKVANFPQFRRVP